MNTLDLCNSALITVTDVFMKDLEAFEGEKLAAATRQIYDGAIRDSQVDDSALCARLDADAMEEYAILVDTFQTSLDWLRALEDKRGERIFSSKTLVAFFARLAAKRSALSAFRTLH